MKQEMTFAEREAEFNREWEKRIDNINKWEALRNAAPQPDKPAVTTASTQQVLQHKITRIGDKIERSAERKEKRAKQVLAVLKAFINAPNGFTDQELVARGIGGSDGPRRRRTIREKLGVSFTVTPDAETGCTRWSLADRDHARKVFAAGIPVVLE